MILAETFSRDWLLTIAKRFAKTVDLKLLKKSCGASGAIEASESTFFQRTPVQS